MALPTLHAFLDRSTVEARDVDGFPARFLLYPQIGADATALARQVQADLQRFAAATVVDTDTGRPVVILVLPTRIMLRDPAAFEAAYEMVQQYGLKSAEPELYTDYFPETETLPGTDGVDEGLFDACWAPVEPEIDGKPMWALEMMRVPQAWEFSSQQGRPTMGEGIVVAQPDTGITDHPELKDVPLIGAIDLIAGGSLATDPLDYIGNTSHGTGTGSVLLSRSMDKVTGAAPAATHMPIRAIHSVVRVSQLSIAQAINHAVDNGAHVITMSLGGLPSLFLWLAVRRAVENNLIVLAAAGNCVKTVVWPARYDACIAVAGVNIKEQPWRGSCRGSAVDIAAPGENVLKALAVRNDNVNTYKIEQGQGTSFAVALTAGVAALWLAHHGRDTVAAAAKEQNTSIQALFKRLLKFTARRPNTDWDEGNMGAGIVNAEALLKASLTAGFGDEATSIGTPPADSIRNFLYEANADSLLDDDGLDLFGMELANVALAARQCCNGGDEGNEGAAAPVSDTLCEAVPATTIERLKNPLP